MLQASDEAIVATVLRSLAEAEERSDEQFAQPFVFYPHRLCRLAQRYGACPSTQRTLAKSSSTLLVEVAGRQLLPAGPFGIAPEEGKSNRVASKKLP
jgi:hypothetical protein